MASCVSSIATVVIGYYAYQSHKLAEQHRQELADLYQAIVIATLLSGTSGQNEKATNKAIEIFSKNYKGEIKIFKNEITRD